MRLWFHQNIPLILWTLWAGFVGFFPEISAVSRFPHWIWDPCIGCGLTRDYAALLSGNPTDNIYFWIVLLLFTLNLGQSSLQVIVQRNSMKNTYPRVP